LGIYGRLLQSDRLFIGEGMSLRHNDHQILYPHRCEMYPALPLCHGAEANVEPFVLDPLNDFRRIPHSKAAVHLQFFMSPATIADQAGCTLAPPRVDISELDQSFCLSCPRTHFLDPGIQRSE